MHKQKGLYEQFAERLARDPELQAREPPPTVKPELVLPVETRLEDLEKIFIGQIPTSNP